MRLLASIAALLAFPAAAFGQGDGRVSSLDHYRSGEMFLQEHDYQAAASEFREALNGDLDPKWIEVWSYIALGKIFDLTGQHERAMNEFRRALETGDDSRGAQAEAIAQLRHDEPLDVRPLPAGMYRTGNGVLGPEPIQRTAPEYSEEAHVAGLEGTVYVSGAITEDGSPRDMRVTGSLGLGLDEKAIEAVEHWKFSPGTRAGKPVPVFESIAVDFLLPEKMSRWHLMGVQFQTPEGASRPVFSEAYYPPGAGISALAIDEGWTIAAVRRLATVTLSFDVDEHGSPVNFRVINASRPIWGEEAVSLVGGWRFKPGMKDDVPVSVPCVVNLIWGQKILTAATLAEAREWLNRAPLTAQSTLPDARDELPPGLTQTVQAPILYTDEDRRLKLEGNLEVAAVIGEDGVPRDLRLIEPLRMSLDDKAIQAISQWRFQPWLVNGRPAAIPVVVEVFFRLRDQAPSWVVLLQKPIRH
jgi:TonB family protein